MGESLVLFNLYSGYVQRSLFSVRNEMGRVKEIPDGCVPVATGSRFLVSTLDGGAHDLDNERSTNIMTAIHHLCAFGQSDLLFSGRSYHKHLNPYTVSIYNPL
jgi:hypothetical protein